MGNKPEFKLLFKYNKYLALSQLLRMLIRPEALISIADHIRVCDHLVESSDENMMLFTTLELWKSCHRDWLKTRLAQEENIEIPDLILKTVREGPGILTMKAFIERHSYSRPRKEWEDDINNKDREYLDKLFKGQF